IQDKGAERERVTRGFKQILRSHSALAKKRAAVIQSQMDDFIAAKLAKHRAGVVLERALCEVAREIVLGPAWASAPSTVHVAPDAAPAGVDWFVARVPRFLSNREARALELGGVLDPSVDRKLVNITQHIQRLADGGEDVSRMTGVEAYATSLHVHWSQGKYPVTRFLNELDPDIDRPGDATPVMFVFSRLAEEAQSSSAVIRTRDEWMALGIYTLFALDPEFDGRQVGLREALPW